MLNRLEFCQNKNYILTRGGHADKYNQSPLGLEQEAKMPLSYLCVSQWDLSKGGLEVNLTESQVPACNKDTTPPFSEFHFRGRSGPVSIPLAAEKRQTFGWPVTGVGTPLTSFTQCESQERKWWITTGRAAPDKVECVSRIQRKTLTASDIPYHGDEGAVRAEPSSKGWDHELLVLYQDKVETSSAYPERTPRHANGLNHPKIKIGISGSHCVQSKQGSQPEHTSHINPSCVIAWCCGCVRIYLSQFGYLPPTVRNRGTIMSEDTMKKAVAEFQAFAGLNITGLVFCSEGHWFSWESDKAVNSRCKFPDSIPPETTRISGPRTPDLYSNLDLPVIGSLVHSDNSASDHAATERMANRPQCTQSLLNPRPLRLTTRSTSHYTDPVAIRLGCNKERTKTRGGLPPKQEGERDWRDGIPPAGHCFADGTNLWDTGLIMRDYNAGRTATKLDLDSPPPYRDRERLQFEMIVPLSDVTQLPLLLASVNASSFVWKPMGHSVYSA
uniref:Uncharacterized protein n=1 Tax=Timema genevievae TaxID=629358 RepID=A0A7R9PP98_TIMGE|nr:unnamed protein product [Timema genevievae]